MIPVSLYGIDADLCERFYEALPSLVSDAYEDTSYIEALYEIDTEHSIDHIRIAAVSYTHLTLPTIYSV